IGSGSVGMRISHSTQGIGVEWEHDMRTAHAMGNGRATMVTRAGQHWLSHLHRFIDQLAEEEPPEAFFAQLTTSSDQGQARCMKEKHEDPSWCRSQGEPEQ